MGQKVAVVNAGVGENKSLMRSFCWKFCFLSSDQMRLTSGIEKIFRFFSEKKKMTVAQNVLEELAATDDKASVIIAHALAGDCQLCGQVTKIFIDLQVAQAEKKQVKFMSSALYVGKLGFFLL
ncbi:MAG: hypothetical protein OEL66_00660 [Desulfobulbaceae bacterium]|nr:hypothetical protein [Desulfobulbaceae bacterium]